MDELKKAIEAAGRELRDEHEWGLDDDSSLPILDTLFARVMLAHVAPVIDPEAVRAAKAAKIAALRAELAALEADA